MKWVGRNNSKIGIEWWRYIILRKKNERACMKWRVEIEHDLGRKDEKSATRDNHLLAELDRSAYRFPIDIIRDPFTVTSIVYERRNILCRQPITRASTSQNQSEHMHARILFEDVEKALISDLWK